MSIIVTKLNDSAEVNSRLVETLSAHLEPLGFTNMTSSDDDYPSLSYVGDCPDISFELRIQVGAHTGPKNLYIHSEWEDYDPLNAVYYQGTSTTEALSVIKKIIPAFRIYSILLDRGYSVGYTGGGCTDWTKEFGDYNHNLHSVTVSNDSAADMLDRLGDYDFETPEFLYAGVRSMYAEAIETSAGELDKVVPTNDTLGFTKVLENLEAIALRESQKEREV